MGNNPYMKNKGVLIAALSLLVVGVIGVAVVAVSSYGPSGSGYGSFTSTGQEIYYTGADKNGPIPRTVAGGGFMGLGMMGEVACVDCHGQDGRGGRAGMMFGTVDIPDIRYSALSMSRSEDGTTIPGWSDADIARAIRDGVEPNGQPLKAPMPRWSMSDTELQEIIAYLKELGSR